MIQLTGFLVKGPSGVYVEDRDIVWEMLSKSLSHKMNKFTPVNAPLMTQHLSPSPSSDIGLPKKDIDGYDIVVADKVVYFKNIDRL